MISWSPRLKSLAICAAALVAVPALAAEPRPPLLARQVIERIQKNIGVPWTVPTVDTIKAGDPDTPVTGIAVTMMATLDVLQRAAAAGKNMVITHEPTFYSHQDQIADLQANNDPVLAAKLAFIRDHHMVVWRFHDHWHRRRPDGIQVGMAHAFGWEKFQSTTDPEVFTLPQTSLRQLAATLAHSLKAVGARVVGDPDLKVTRVGMLPGAPASRRQIAMLARDDIDVLVSGEVPEWETVEYVADAVAAGKHKAIILLTHILSEQAGMEVCARWLKPMISEVPVDFVPAREPFWLPR